MKNKYADELIEVSSTSSHPLNEISGETTVQMMRDFTNVVIGLSQHIAENNEAKYKAQAEVMIAEIQANMQTELKAINSYDERRERLEERFDQYMASYQEQLKLMINQLMSAKNETETAMIENAIDKWKSNIGYALDRIEEKIASEQHEHLEQSKERNRGLFGLFRKK